MKHTCVHTHTYNRRRTQTHTGAVNREKGSEFHLRLLIRPAAETEVERKRKRKGDLHTGVAGEMYTR